MSDDLQHFIPSLQQDIKEWEDAAQFYEKQVHSVQNLGKEEVRTRKAAEKFRARIAERRELIEQLRRDAGGAVFVVCGRSTGCTIPANGKAQCCIDRFLAPAWDRQTALKAGT